MAAKSTCEELEQVKKECRRLEKALAESEDRYRQIFEIAPAGIWEVDFRTGRFISVNDAICEYSGYSKNELLSLSPIDILTEESKKLFLHRIGKILKGERVPDNLEYEVYKKDGSKIWLSINNRFEYDSDGITRSTVIACDITERKKTEDTIRESERRYRLLADNVTDIIWTIDMDMQPTYYSPSITRIQGFTVEEAMNRSIEESMTPASYDTVVKAITEELESLNNGTRDPDKSKTVEVELYCKDGSTIWAEIEANFFYNANGRPEGIIGITRDITARKKAEKELLDSKKKFRLFIDSSPDLCFLKDIEGRYLLVNNANARFFGKEESDIIGKTDFDLMPPEAAQMCHATDLKSITEKKMIISQECVGQRVYETRKIPVITDDHVVSVAGIIRDITEQEHLQKQLQQSHKLEAIGTLAGGVAHDFNNILSIILGNAEIALDDIPKLNPAYYSLKNIKEASLRAAGIVNQLLSFSYKSEPTLKPIRVMAVVKDSIRFLRSMIPTTIEIRNNIPDTGEIILGDPVQINQIMINLCVNAAHEMEETGGVLMVSAEKVTLPENEIVSYRHLPGGDYVSLTVSDTGRGIDTEIIDKIFDPYFTTKEFGRGSGMGLSVVHGIVKNHNGSISVDSNPGKGAAFTVLFPVIDKECHPETDSEDSLPSGMETILLVDDEELILNVTGRMLNRFGYHVETKSSPEEALKLFRAKPDAFDLVITDMTMPHMTGVQLSTRLLEIRPDIPVIICTGHSPLVDEEKAKAMGIAAYVLKPIEKKVITQLIRNVLDK